MDVILAEAQKRGMQVWLLDDDHCPTGHAAGLIAKKYPDLRKWNLAERHIDVCGPMKDGAVLVSETGAEHILLGATPTAVSMTTRRSARWTGSS